MEQLETLGATQVDFRQWHLEQHVRESLAEAERLAGGTPINARYALLAAIKHGGSSAFRNVASMLPTDAANPPSPLEPGTGTSLAAASLAPGLAKSLSVSQEFWERKPRVWGRDYITTILLAGEDPSLGELADAANTTVEALQDDWFEYVTTDPSYWNHREVEEWQEWWRAAGVPLPEERPPTNQSSGNAYLLTWDPQLVPFDRLEEAKQEIDASGHATINWSVGDRHPSIGDRVFFMRHGSEAGLVGFGRVVTRAVRLPHWNKLRKGDTKLFADIRLDFLEERPVVSEKELVEKTGETSLWGAHGSGHPIPQKIAWRLGVLWRDAGHPTPTESASAGSRHEARWDASDGELCLGIQEYAEVLARLLRDAARGDFCFALFGQWGRGKTAQTKALERVLTDETNAANEGTEKGRYEIVWFKAWEYRTTPEVWIHLYETFRDACLDRSVLESFPRVARAGIAHNGLKWLTLCIWSMALSLLPLQTRLHLLMDVAAWLGLGAALFFYRVYNGGRRHIDGALRRYGRLSDHREKLGMQALIGDDLRSLLRGWIPDPNGEFLRQHRVSLFLLALGFAAYAGTLLWTAWQVPDMTTTSKAIVALWLMLICLLPIWVMAWGRRTRKILFVVDDLDRCETDQMLNIIESLKLLLEKDSIKSRVQIIMLIEPSALENAVRDRFGALIDTRVRLSESSEHETVAKTVVREHIEKLFISHLTLGPLTEADVDELGRHYLGLDTSTPSSSQEEPVSQNPPQVPSSTPGQGSPSAPSEPIRDPQEPSTPSEIPPPSMGMPRRAARVDAELSDEERRQLLEAVRYMCSGEQGKLRRIPRTIRAFKFKYLLARMLLQKQSYRPVPADLVGALCHWTMYSRFDEGHFDKRIESAVRHVGLGYR